MIFPGEITFIQSRRYKTWFSWEDFKLKSAKVMASSVPYSMRNELLNSGSEEDSDDVSEIATRTRRSKKKERAPRPLEPHVQVQNDLEHAERSGEVSEDRDLGYGGIWSANKVKLNSKPRCFV